MTHHFTASVTGLLLNGNPIVISRDVCSWRRVASETRARRLIATPAQIARMTREQGGGHPGAIGLALSTAAPLGQGTARDFLAATSVPVGQAYGLIEVGFPFADTAPKSDSTGSVGTAMPGAELRLEDVGL